MFTSPPIAKVQSTVHQFRTLKHVKEDYYKTVQVEKILGENSAKRQRDKNVHENVNLSPQPTRCAASR